LTDLTLPVSVSDFSELGLSAKVLAAVKETGYTTPTPIQAASIPAVLQHRDVLGIAQTGTGKTASFVLPMLTLLEKGRARARMPRTLIISPTRELAAQTAENFEKYGKNYRLNIALLIGGVSFDEQNRKLERGADVLIATPGRLLDHFGRGKLLLNAVELLVIDEADRMLDMGFIPDIEQICKLLPMTRQTLLFSATMPRELEELANKFLHNSVRVEVAAASSAAKTIHQFLVKSGKKPWEKRDVLRRLIRSRGDALNNAIIFCNRKRDVSELFRSLEKHGFDTGALHGDMDQTARMQTLDKFRHDQLRLLVASDVAARGLDIPEVSHVFNFDVPIHAEDYVHRIGRTGRAGREGTAFTLITKTDNKAVAAIEQLIGETIPYLPPADIGLEAENEAVAAEAKTETDEKPAKKGSLRTTRGRRTKAEAAGPIKAENAEGIAVETSAHEADEDKPKQPRRRNTKAAKTPEVEAPAGEVAAPAETELKYKAEPKHETEKTAPKRMPRDNRVYGFGNDMPAFMLIPTSVA